VKEIISTGLEDARTPPLVTAVDLDGADAMMGEEVTERRHLCVGVADQGERLDKWLALQLPAFSRAYFQQLLAGAGVCLNGVAVSKPAQRLRVGDRVKVELRPTAQASAFLPEVMDLSVVYEDEHLLVIDKPAGLVVHPAAGHWQGTLLNGLLAYHAAAVRLPRAGIVHRLDKDTSGLMLVGKSPQAVEGLVRMIAAREVHRLYLALAHGPWRHPDEVWVDRPIGRDSRQRLRMAVHEAASSAAKPAQTRMWRLDGHGAQVLLACKLHTGRTHQIRVHAAWLGSPLLADAVYGGRPGFGLQRQALHAHRLALSHPVTGRWMTFASAGPTDWQEALHAADLHYNEESVRSLMPDAP